MAYLFTEILIIGWHTDIQKRLCEKDQGNKIKDSVGAYDINLFTSVLTRIHFVKRTLQHFCFKNLKCASLVLHIRIYRCKL